MHFVYSTTKYAIYASNELLMSNFGVYLQLKPLRYGVDEKKQTDDVTTSNKCTRLYKALTEFSYGLPSYLYAIILEVVAVLKLLCLNTILRHIISIKRISAS